MERLPPKEVLPPGGVAARGVDRIEVVGERHVTRPPRDGAWKVVEVREVVARLDVDVGPISGLGTALEEGSTPIVPLALALGRDNRSLRISLGLALCLHPQPLLGGGTCAPRIGQRLLARPEPVVTLVLNLRAEA
eukprot:scaffold63046_cov62-Phaeocystis_antarctica.AAC.1